MNPQIESTINGLKYNVKVGFNKAEQWNASYNKALKNLLKSWKEIEDYIDSDEPIVEPMAWETVQDHPHWKVIDSEVLDMYSKIGVLVIAEKTYTTKKGITKTTPEQTVPAHYTQKGQYLGRVSDMGTEPVVYPIAISITPRHFKYVGVGKTLEDCFELKDESKFLTEGKFLTADIHRSEMKEFRAKKREEKKAQAIAPIKRVKPKVAPAVEELDDE